MDMTEQEYTTAICEKLGITNSGVLSNWFAEMIAETYRKELSPGVGAVYVHRLVRERQESARKDRELRGMH